MFFAGESAVLVQVGQAGWTVATLNIRTGRIATIFKSDLQILSCEYRGSILFQCGEHEYVFDRAKRQSARSSTTRLLGVQFLDRTLHHVVPTELVRSTIGTASLRATDSARNLLGIRYDSDTVAVTSYESPKQAIHETIRLFNRNGDRRILQRPESVRSLTIQDGQVFVLHDTGEVTKYSKDFKKERNLLRFQVPTDDLFEDLVVTKNSVFVVMQNRVIGKSFEPTTFGAVIFKYDSDAAITAFAANAERCIASEKSGVVTSFKLLHSKFARTP